MILILYLCLTMVFPIAPLREIRIIDSKVCFTGYHQSPAIVPGEIGYGTRALGITESIKGEKIVRDSVDFLLTSRWATADPL